MDALSKNMINHISIKTIDTPVRNWRPANLENINQRFEDQPPEELLRWALATYGDSLVVATGFGGSGIVQMHMIAQFRPKTTFFYLQTDLLFPETLALRDELSARLGIQFTEVHSGLSLGEQAYPAAVTCGRVTRTSACLHKVRSRYRNNSWPISSAWITAIRAATSRPAGLQTPIGRLGFRQQALNLAPLAAERAGVGCIDHHGLPYNKLRDAGHVALDWLCACTRRC